MDDFDFYREWVTPAPVDRVREVLDDLEHYPLWWPQVVAVASIDDETARVLCRSKLPYTLDLVLQATRREDRALEVEISGDLSGWSRFTLGPESDAGQDGTRVSYEQHVVVAHRGLAIASQILRPLLRWNHDQMMRGCELGLEARASG